MAHPVSIPISVDPRIELIGMVFAQTSWEEEIFSWGNFDHRDYPYFQEIKSLLAPFSDHPALTIAERLVTEQRFIWDAIPEFILFHESPPLLAPQRSYDAYIIDRAGSEEILFEFSDALRDFADQILFESFYAQHRNFYADMVNEIQCHFPHERLIPLLEDFFGWQQSSYGVILAPCMFPGGGNGLRIPNGETYDTYELIRVTGIQGDMPDFGSSDWIFELAVHEFAHSFINPTAEKWKAEILQLKPLYQSIENSLKQNVSKDWVTKVNEQLVVAYTLFILLNEGITQNRQEQVEHTKTHQGLYMTGELIDLFAHYSQDRIKYPTFESLYPAIIDLYKDAANAKHEQYGMTN